MKNIQDKIYRFLIIFFFFFFFFQNYVCMIMQMLCLFKVGSAGKKLKGFSLSKNLLG